MRKTDRPTELPQDVFRTCISRVRDPNLKQRLEQCVAEIISKANEFDNNVINATLHTIITSDNVSGIVTADEMIKVYTDRMVGKTSPGRFYYDKLKSVPAHGRCPLCGQRVISTLDHHLPKAHYPALAVTPINLIPSCYDCNKTKSDNIPNNSSEETLHPYFDDVEIDYWLKCSVNEYTPVSLYFFADPPKCWGDLLSNRLKYHFTSLNLAELYISHASEELLSIYFSVQRLFDSGGKKAVQMHLQDTAQSRASVYKNSWQTAMYTALANNEWYCDGGFR